jgi:hypothetical protein
VTSPAILTETSDQIGQLWTPAFCHKATHMCDKHLSISRYQAYNQIHTSATPTNNRQTNKDSGQLKETTKHQKRKETLPGLTSPCCIFSTRAVASGRRRRPFTFRRPVPKQTPQTRDPRPKHWGHSTNSYVSLARLRFRARHFPVPPHMSQGVTPVPAHSRHLGTPSGRPVHPNNPCNSTMDCSSPHPPDNTNETKTTTQRANAPSDLDLDQHQRNNINNNTRGQGTTKKKQQTQTWLCALIFLPKD